MRRADNIFEHISRNETLIGSQSVGSMANTVKSLIFVIYGISNISSIRRFSISSCFSLCALCYWRPDCGRTSNYCNPGDHNRTCYTTTDKRSSEGAITDGKSKQSVLIEMLNGLETLKSLKGVNLIKERWSNSVSQQGLKMLKSRFWSQLTSNFAQSGQQLSQIGIVVYGVFLIMTADLTMGALIACVILSGRTLAPLGQMSNLLGRFTMLAIIKTLRSYLVQNL